MCPGTINIINNLDDLVDKCNQKISLVRRAAEDGSRNTLRIETKYNSLNLPRKSEEVVIKSNRIKQAKNDLTKNKKIKLKNKEIKRNNSKASIDNMSSRMSLRTISEVSNSASNINSRSSRSILGYSNISPTKDHKRNQIRNKLDYFYMDNNSQASSKVVSPKASANVVNIEQNMNHQALINSTKMINNLVLKK